MAERWAKAAALLRSGRANCAAPSPSPSPTACRAAATRRASNGSRSAGAGFGWTPHRRSPAANGWRSPRLPAQHRARGSCPPRQSSCSEVEALFADEIEAYHRGPLRSGDGRDQRDQGPQARCDQAFVSARSPARPGGDRGRACSTPFAAMGWRSCRGATAALALRQRAAFAARHDPAIPDLGDAALLARLDEWLAPLASGKRRLDAIGPASLSNALEGLLGYEAGRAIDRLAPTHFDTPAGSSHPIDYAAPGGPTVEVRAQALYGLKEHPMVAGGRVPLTLAITSPAHRPIQTTKDLPAFWAGSWREVAKEMRGRYPKHPWPDDPAAAPPTLRTKRAQSS